MRGRVKSREIVEHGRVGLLVILVVVVVVVGGGSGRRAAVDEGGVDHRQVEAGRKHVDVRMGAHGVQSGGHPAASCGLPLPRDFGHLHTPSFYHPRLTSAVSPLSREGSRGGLEKLPTDHE